MKKIFLIVLLLLLPLAQAQPWIFKLSQSIEGSRAFFVFTKGDWTTIENRMALILGGTFFQHISPSFAFGLGILHPLKLLLHYDTIDLEGWLSLERGYHKIIIENNGTVSGKPQIIIRKG